jgi:hypothetical protein
MSIIIWVALMLIVVGVYLYVFLGKSQPQQEEKEVTSQTRQFNPLNAKVGQFISFSEEQKLAGLDFAITKFIPYEIRIGRKRFYQADYCLKANQSSGKPIRARLRLIEDENETNQWGSHVQFLQIFHEMPYDESMYNLCMSNGDHSDQYDDPGEVTFKVNYDADGNELEPPHRYWRCEDATEPYHAVAYEKGDGDHDVTFWDFSRITEDEGDQKVTENLVVEMENETHSFTILRGPDLKAFQVTLT